MATEFTPVKGGSLPLTNKTTIDTNSGHVIVHDPGAGVKRVPSSDFGVGGGSSLFDYYDASADITDLTGATDQAANLQTAADNAIAAEKILLLPRGSIRVNSKVEIKTPLVGHGGVYPDVQATASANEFGTRILGGVNNGDALLWVDALAGSGPIWKYFFMIGVHFDGNNLNCRGFASGLTSGAGSLSRVLFEDCYFRQCDIGSEVYGWHQVYNKCHWELNATTGSRVWNANATSFNHSFLRSNATDSWALEAYAWNNTVEPAPPATAARAAVFAMNDCVVESKFTGTNPCNGARFSTYWKSIAIRSTYFEKHNDQSAQSYALDIGSVDRNGATIVSAQDPQDYTQSVSIKNCAFQLPNDAANDDLGPDVRMANIYSLVVKETTFDKRFFTVEDSVISASIARSDVQQVRTTAPEIWGHGRTGNLIDKTGRVGRVATSWNLNPNFKNGLHGFKRIVQGGGLAHAEETTITRDGVSALKVTQTAAATNYLVAYFHGVSDIVSAGDLVAMVGWARIDSAGTTYANRTDRPRFGFGYETSGGDFGNTYTTEFDASPNPLYLPHDEWFQIFGWMIAPAGVLDIGLGMSPLTDNASAAAHSVYLADWHFFIEPGDLEAIKTGLFSYDLRAGTRVGPNFIWSGTGPPSGSNRARFMAGDKYIQAAPALDKYGEYTCTASSAMDDNGVGTWEGSGGMVLRGSDSWDPGVINQGASASNTFTVTGASVGDKVEVWNTSGSAQFGHPMWGEITAADTLTVTLHNGTLANQNPVNFNFDYIVTPAKT